MYGNQEFFGLRLSPALSIDAMDLRVLLVLAVYLIVLPTSNAHGLFLYGSTVCDRNLQNGHVNADGF